MAPEDTTTSSRPSAVQSRSSARASKCRRLKRPEACVSAPVPIFTTTLRAVVRLSLDEGDPGATERQPTARGRRLLAPSFLMLWPRSGRLWESPQDLEIYGNTLGLKPSELQTLRNTYRRRVSPELIVSPELARHLT